MWRRVRTRGIRVREDGDAHGDAIVTGKLFAPESARDV